MAQGLGVEVGELLVPASNPYLPGKTRSRPRGRPAEIPPTEENAKILRPRPPFLPRGNPYRQKNGRP